MSTKVLILGITGSIGQTALRGISQYDSVEVVGGTYYSRPYSADFPLLNLKIDANKIDANKTDANRTNTNKTNVSINNTSRNAIEQFIRKTQPDVVLNGISGSAGLEASIAVVKSGCKTLALANKETIVIGGKTFLEFAKCNNVNIIPVDSEHSAIYELLKAHKVENTDKLIITASGGPFIDTPEDELERISPEKAANHPTWKMGKKISIDSATLANKALEVIEASYLFDFRPENIEVVIHPQSVVHSMIRTKNGQIYAQMSPPDMVFPIMRAILGDNISHPAGNILDFSNLNLCFRKLDFKRFPFVKLAYECLEKGALYPAVFNIADEVAVDAFVNGKIGFTDIFKVVEKALQLDYGTGFDCILETSDMLETIKRKVVEKCL